MTREGKAWVYYPCVAVLLQQAQSQQLPCSCLVDGELMSLDMTEVVQMCHLPFHMYKVALCFSCGEDTEFRRRNLTPCMCTEKNP